MYVGIKMKIWLVMVLVVAGMVICSFSAQAASATRVGVLNMQMVMAKSEAGKKAQQALKKKMKELKASFKKEEQKLLALQKEIEKKSSAWSDEVRQEKAIEYQKKRRDLNVKQEDANLELKKIRERHVGPILKKLEKVVAEVAKKEGVGVVIPANVALYREKSLDITDKVIKALNKILK